MKRLFLFLLLATTAFATPFACDLGQGLSYHRVHQLPGDLPTGETERRQPCILDLRYVEGGPEEATALAAWLKFHATARAPVLVLANADTSSALLAALVPRGATGSLVVLGVASASFTPDIALKISAAVERRAYDALEHGATADSLIAEKSDKPRNDEAQLAKDRQPEAGAAVDESVPSAAPADESAKPKPPPPLVDAVLQRAVQLHRALLALKKL